MNRTRAFTWGAAILASAAFWGCMAEKAFACDSYVAHLSSYHTDRDLIPDVNEINPGVGCRVGRAEVGVYKNSYADLTAYAVFDTDREGWALFGGVATGYHADTAVPDHGITPVAGVAYHGESTTVRMMPSYSVDTGNIGMVMSFSVNFGG